MPIDYKKYPPNWLTEIRPRIMKRANNKCEQIGCSFEHNQIAWKVKYKGRIQWFHTRDFASLHPSTTEFKNGKYI